MQVHITFDICIEMGITVCHSLAEKKNIPHINENGLS